MRTIRAKSPGEFPRLLDYIHDRKFQLDDLRYEEETQRLCIPLTVICQETLGPSERSWLLLRRRYPVSRAELIVEHVEEHVVVDQAQIGAADVNEISSSEDEVVITCGVPVTIRARVSALDVRLEISDDVVGEKSYYSLW